jgi:hypothetical protein
MNEALQKARDAVDLSNARCMLRDLGLSDDDPRNLGIVRDWSTKISIEAVYRSRIDQLLSNEAE